VQSKLSSFKETLTQTLIGYVVSLAGQFIIYPVYGHTFTVLENLQIGVWFLLLSLVRGYVIRRFFNKKVKHANTHT
jgi:hypothetical protein